MRITPSVPFENLESFVNAVFLSCYSLIDSLIHHIEVSPWLSSLYYGCYYMGTVQTWLSIWPRCNLQVIKTKTELRSEKIPIFKKGQLVW